MDQNPSSSLFGLQIDMQTVSKFREGSAWARFICIVAFACCFLAAIALLFAGASMKGVVDQYVPGMGMMDMEALGFVVIGIVLVVLAIFIVIYVLLFRFATLVRRGINEDNQEIFNDGLKNLKYYFIINGVLSLLGIVFTLITTITELLV